MSNINGRDPSDRIQRIHYQTMHNPKHLLAVSTRRDRAYNNISYASKIDGPRWTSIQEHVGIRPSTLKTKIISFEEAKQMAHMKDQKKQIYKPQKEARLVNNVNAAAKIRQMVRLDELVSERLQRFDNEREN